MDNGLSQTSKNVTREACDRCHTIKSRCSKAPDSVICKRCERFGVSCTYSAPLRRGRPKGGGSGGCSNMYSFPERPVQKRTRHAPKKSDTSLQNATVEQDEPWMSLGMGIDLDTENEPEINQENRDFPDPATFHSQLQWQENNSLDILPNSGNDDAGLNNQETHGLEFPTLVYPNDAEPNILNAVEDIGVEQLRSSTEFSNVQTPRIECRSDLLINRLLDLQRTLYVLSGPSFEAACKDSESDGTYCSDMEETFNATETLVEIIHALHEKPPHGKSCPTHRVRTNGSGIPLKSPTLPDYATVLLIFSCYLRLLNVYELLVTFLNATIRQSASSHGIGKLTVPNDSPSAENLLLSNSSSIAIPVVNIGQFNVAASPIMNLQLLLYFIEEMLGRLQTAIQLCSTSRSSTADAVSYSVKRKFTSPYGLNTVHTIGLDDLAKSKKNCIAPDVSTVFDDMLVHIEGHEKELIRSLRGLKDHIRSKPSFRCPHI